MENGDFYPVIEISGTPREMGLQHGRQLRTRIRRTVQAMRERIGPEACEASWPSFQQTMPYCRANAPELVEEMEGIAEGAEIEFRDVLNINAHLDLANWRRLVWNAHNDADTTACSSHAVVTDADVLLGWNGDDWRGWMDCGVVVSGRPDRGRPFIYWSLAGSVGRPGMTPHLALGANSLPSPRWRAEGLLYPMLCRKLLACCSAEEALEVFDRYPRCSAMNYLVADRSGLLIDIESTDDRHAVLSPQGHGPGSYLLHTNSYLDADLTESPLGPQACPRLAAAQRLYAERTPADVAQVREIQSDHTGGICVHRPDICTIVSFVAEIRRGRFHVTRGNPCQAPVRTCTLHME